MFVGLSTLLREARQVDVDGALGANDRLTTRRAAVGTALQDLDVAVAGGLVAGRHHIGIHEQREHVVDGRVVRLVARERHPCTLSRPRIAYGGSELRGSRLGGNMTMETETSRRPGGVTFVVVLAYIVSIFTVLDGIFVMLDADTSASADCFRQRAKTS